jgi:hypothetical protein
VTRLLAALALVASLAAGPAHGFHFNPAAELDTTRVTWTR